MDFSEVGKAIKKYAPILGTVIGGPVGGAIGGAVSLVASAFGVEGDDPDDILRAIQADPEAAIKLKQIENDHELQLKAMALEADRLQLADVASARDREAKIVAATGKRDVNLYLLAWLLVAGFFCLCAALFYKALPEGQTDIIFMLFGTLATAFGSVIQYFFGSSKSSTDKTMLMHTKTK
jgi:hypothetical protein